MAQVCLVSCVKTKLSASAPAKDLYISSWFRKASLLAAQQHERWFILSAKYGLVAPEERIAPYEKTLNQMPRSEREVWAREVFDALRAKIAPQDTITIFAGERYREYLVPLLETAGFRVAIPMKGLRSGKQLRWLNAQLFKRRRRK